MREHSPEPREARVIMVDSPANSVLHALGFALFVREPSGALRATGGPPPWLKSLWPEIGSGKDALDSGVSPFLENFLIDAEECWRLGGEQRVRSGPWVEQEPGGDNVQLEATALTIDGQSVLLLERLGEAFEAKKAMLQKARENVIAYQRLNSEIQKKEILLHCLAEDMTAAVANVITALRLVELQNSSPKSKMLLGLATRATEEQQALIHRVLEVFAEELSGLFGQNGETENEADVLLVIGQAVAATAEMVSEKKVRLTSPGDFRETTVTVNPRQLGRVISNLIENALEHAPTQIALALENEEKSVVLRIADNGQAVESPACENLFAKYQPTAGVLPPSALRLHFCRLILEGAGGEIGCTQPEAGGSEFWLRLPKIFA